MRTYSTLPQAAATAEGEGHGAGPASHTPYRDSLLTKLLKDSLGGASLTPVQPKQRVLVFAALTLFKTPLGNASEFYRGCDRIFCRL